MSYKIEYVNEYKVKKRLSGISFMVLTVLGFVTAVCALCVYMVLCG